MARGLRPLYRKRYFYASLLSLVIIFVLVFSLLYVTLSYPNQSASQTYHLPELHISLADVAIEQIDTNPKTIKYPGNTITITTDTSTISLQDVKIKGHGNLTWNQIKKPYQLTLNSKTEILNLGKDKKWLLLANYLDHTYLRNDLAFYLEHILGEPYAMRGNFIELYIDDSYRGLYYLTTKPDISKSRIDLRDPLGIIMELDNIYGTQETCHYSTNQDCFTVKAQVNPDLPATDYFITKYNQLELAIKNQDFNTITELIDIDSFARYYLLNEFLVNPDAYSTSFFLFMDGPNDKIHAGPGWDFDVSAGNRLWSIENESFYSPYNTMFLKDLLSSNNEDTPHINTISTLIYDLMEFPEFVSHVEQLYRKTIYPNRNQILSHLQTNADLLRIPAEKDINRWKIQTTYNEEVTYLTDWVTNRLNYLEKIYITRNANFTPTLSKNES